VKTVTVGEAKNELSALLRLVRRGESVLILNRKRPVARLDPVSPATDEERLTELERQGVICRSRKPLPDYLWKKNPPKTINGASVLAALLEERRERR
jgi:prevent-host-death family protein